MYDLRAWDVYVVNLKYLIEGYGYGYLDAAPLSRAASTGQRAADGQGSLCNSALLVSAFARTGEH